MRRWAIFAAIAGFCWTSQSQILFASPIHVAVIQDYEKMDGIQIIRNQTNANEPFLYDGDRIVGTNLSQLKIETYPYTEVKHISDNEYKIVRERPLFPGVLTVIGKFLGFVQEEEKISFGVSKGATKPVTEQFPRPGYYATLLPDQTANFGWGNANGQTLILCDKSGKEIYARDVQNLTQLDINPKDLGLISGNAYSWKVKGIPETYKIKILETSALSVINLDLKQMDAESGSDDDKRIKKAAYLQLMSDIFPEKLDLYWLSYQLLLEVNPQEATTTKIAEQMKRRYKQHLDDQMQM